MNDPRPAFMFNVVEFWSSAKVSAMDAEAVGVYVFLLSRQWQNGAIPGPELAVRAMCRGIGFHNWRKLWPLIEPCFPVCEDGERRNERLERDRDLADEYSRKQAGRAKSRWGRWKAEKPMPRHSHGNATAMPKNAGAMPQTGQGQDIDRTVGASHPPAHSRGGGTDLTRWWDAEWNRTRPAPFDWVANGKDKGCPDAVALGQLQQQFPVEEIKRRITRYLNSSDLFDGKTATPRMFKSKYATLAFDIVPLKNGKPDPLQELIRRSGGIAP